MCVCAVVRACVCECACVCDHLCACLLYLDACLYLCSRDKSNVQEIRVMFIDVDVCETKGRLNTSWNHLGWVSDDDM